MDTQGKTALLLASYNGEAYIEELLQSLLRQSSRDFVICVHDDGSKDKTPELLSAFAREHPGLVAFIPGKPTGSARDNFFYLLSQVEAPYYLFCDQDDIWLPDKVALSEAKMREIERPGQPALVFTELTVVDARGKTIAERMSEFQQLDMNALSFPRLLIQNVVSGCTMLINRRLRDMALLSLPAEEIAMHDWYLALIASRFGTLGFVSTPTLLYRQHGDNSVGAKKFRSLPYLLSRLFSGDIPASLALTRRQAAFFAAQFQEGAESLSVRYGALGELRKGQRLRFYLREGMRKSGWLRNLGLLVWG